MTDIEIIKGLECHSKPSNSCGSSCPYLMCEEILCTKKLTKDALDLINRKNAEIEQLKSQLPPIKVGDTVFLPIITDFETVEQYEVIEVGQDKEGQFFRIDDEESNKVYVVEIGETVFLTPKEAAEKALKGSEDNAF